jgi:aminoglycoside 6'-N-acetyltransferase
MEQLSLHAGRVGVRAAAASDEALVGGWLSDPENYAYWGGSAVSPQDIRAHCAIRIEPGETVWAYIILEDDAPVGYLQAWRKFGGDAGFDVFLVQEARGRGVGSAALRLMAEHVTAVLRWPAVTVDPERTNTCAIRAFAKAGFVARGSPHDTDTHVVMTFDPASSVQHLH